MTVNEWHRMCRADIAANRGYPKSIAILVVFRTTQLLRCRRGAFNRLAYVAVASAYKLFSEWLLGVELPPGTCVGGGLRLRHGVGLVVNPATVIAEDVMLRHCVTLGNRGRDNTCPVIERGVEIGAGATIIGGVTVGEGARIGAGALVLDDVPPRAVVLAPKAIVASQQKD